MNKPTSDSLFFLNATSYVAFFITLSLAALYVWSVGIVAVWPDTLFYADRARHFLEQGNISTTANYATTLHPLYSLLMLPAFLAPDIMTGHWILVGLQTLLLSSVFFPVRVLLLRSTGFGNLEASVLSMLAALAAIGLPYAPMLSVEALFIPLFIWFACFYDGWLHHKNKAHAIAAGVLLGLMLLAKETGWVVFAAVILNEVLGLYFVRKSSRTSIWSHLCGQMRRSGIHLCLTPLIFFTLWQMYSLYILNQPFHIPEWNLNNPLARFNFVKNGLLYVCYAGMPLAGLAFLISALSKHKETWTDVFFRFSFFCIIGIIFYAAFSNTVIVEQKLDYITNRLIEPFLILPFIAFARLSETSRKELAANSLLIFFCLMIFGLPYALKADFTTGLGYWAQSLANPNFGIIRNAIYLVLICIPVAFLWWKPKLFAWAYVCIAGLITFANLSQDKTQWSQDEDGNLNFVSVATLEKSDDLKNASAIYADYRCDTEKNNDIAYLYRCFDLGKTIYFLPKLAKPITASDIKKLKLDKDSFIIFASSENDNALGKVVGRIGLSRIMKITAADIDASQSTPLVAITEIEGLKRYVNLPVQYGLERVTLLAEESTMEMDSDAAGCAEMNVLLASDGEEKNVEFTLNDKSVKKMTFKKLQAGNVPDEFVLPLNMKSGKNMLKLTYGIKPDFYNPSNPGLFMFGRPVFKSCSMMRR